MPLSKMGCCGSKQFPGRKVVIVGGGYAGTTLAKKLDPSFEVILIERNEVMVHVMAQLRAVTAPEGYAAQTLIPYDSLLSRGTVRRATVASIRPDCVELDDGETVAITSEDFLIIATGSTTPAPTRWLGHTVAEMSEEQAASATMIRDARVILIVGGGPVGVELAGEIHDVYPDKDVTIVHRGPYLCSGKNGGSNGHVVPAAFGENLATICRDKGVTVRLGHGVTGVESGDPAAGMVTSPGDVSLDDGEVIRGVDLAIFVTGIHVNNETFRSSMAAHLNPQGRLVVSPSMLVDTGARNVFALGDCAEAGGSKTAYHAMQQAQVVASNVLALAGGAADTSLKRYDAGTAAMIVPFGKDLGRAYLPPCGGITLGDGMVSSIKGKDLFLQQTRKDMGDPADATAAASASST